MNSPLHFPGGRWLLGAALALFATPAAFAQVDTYSFAPSTTTFTPLVGGAQMGAVEADDAVSASQAIGFTFVYDGTPYTNFRASSNGFISFANNPGSALTNGLATAGATERPLIAVLWDDLNGSGGGAASRLLTGTAPNRVLTIEWLNWRRYDFSVTTPSVSFQVKLYETTNVIEMIYRRESTTQTFDASIGLAGVGTGSGSFLSLSDAVANPTVSSTTSSDQIADVPPTGQLYRFTPPVPSACPTPRNLTATVNGTSASVAWTVAGGSGTFNVVYGPTGFNPATGGTTLTNVTSPATITNLAPGSYQFYVQQVCGGAAGSSPLSNPGGFSLPCPSPSGLMAGTLTNTTADLTFVGTATPGGSFTIIYGPPGFVPGSGGTTVTGVMGTSTTLTGLTANTTYEVYVQQVCVGSGTGMTLAGPITITTLLTAPANDNPCGATALTAAGALTTSNVGATTSTQPGINLPGCAPSQVPKDVWYSFVAPATQTASLAVTGTAAGQLRVFTTPDCANGPFNQVFCAAANGNNVGFNAPLIVPNLTPGQTYYIAISGWGSSDPSGSFSIQYAAAPLATQVLADTPALTVYPNPSHGGALTLRLAAGPGQATLLNALGQTVRTLALAGTATEHRLPTTGLAAGLYTLQVRRGTEVLTRRVVLE